MRQLIDVFTDTTPIEIELLVATFVLCSLIGLERQVRQKSAGYRTHVLVGLGSCAFTLVSGYGFTLVLGSDVQLDPSRIAAQIVSGIGFLGAGVIFKGRDVVRGLTTAATVWVAAAVGMACGAGMLSLAATVTLLHLVTLFVVAPLIRMLPTPDRHRLMKITYVDGEGTLRHVLALASSMGFSASIVRSRRSGEAEHSLINLDVRFLGKQPLHNLVMPLLEVKGVERVSVSGSDFHADDDSV
ncbi:MgtC/SapB family protein [Microbacterium sp. YY-01]|uniref:MgtC/SapB family protein n=1 Tax=Microbacterium sp. YY-01 TaxID=3421634 RepID=UPI003D178516